MPLGTDWVTKHDLSTLRVLGGTGEPWNPEPWLWYFQHVGGGRCPIINYSGGTEISGGIVGCHTIHPLKPCSFAGPIPGIAADVIDDQGKPVRGSVGELAIRKPWPGMTRGFWRDPERYEETYWSKFPDVWVHGDWATVDDDGFWFIQGRSDDTIKIAGKRVGPAEVESAAVGHPAVAEAAAIGVPHPVKGEGVVLFVVLKPNEEPADALRDGIKDAVAAELGRPLRPEEVRFVTRSPAHPQRQDHAAGDPREAPRRDRPRRPVRPGEPGRHRRDRPRPLTGRASAHGEGRADRRPLTRRDNRVTSPNAVRQESLSLRSSRDDDSDTRHGDLAPPVTDVTASTSDPGAHSD